MAENTHILYLVLIGLQQMSLTDLFQVIASVIGPNDDVHNWFTLPPRNAGDQWGI
jgi:hypothetical protein